MRLILPGICLGAAAVLAPPSVAFSADADTLVRQGNGRGAAPCQSCHGPDGGGMASLAAPRLAGMNASYLRKQLNDFADGLRTEPSMSAIASALDASERSALADYYSRLPVPPAATVPARHTAPTGGLGKDLARRGRWSQQLPACEQCHGPDGVGVGPNFPALTGQPPAYIENQLRAWKAGTRRNDPLQLMQRVSAALSTQDMQAVAAWFASQPPVTGEAKP